MHGGKSLLGPFHPSTTTGRYSKVLPARLLERYESSRNDPNLLSLHEELAVVDARLIEILEQIDAAGAGQIWPDVRRMFRRLKAAQAEKSPRIMRECLVELDALIERGAAETASWNEAIRLIAVRKSLAESERKRHIEMRLMVSVEQGMALMAALAAAVKAHVTDPAALRAISADFSRLIGRPGPE